MRSLYAAILLAASIAAAAADRSYVVLSLAADRIVVTQYQPATGSRLDRNERQVVKLPTNALERDISFAVEDAIKRVEPAAKVTVIGVTDPALREAADLTAEARDVSSALPRIQALVQKVGASHLVLVTKFKGDARARLADGTLGSGYFEGLGFFLDHSRELTNTDTGNRSVGYIAPFASLRFTLVDLGGGAIVREETQTLSTAVGNQKADATWDTLSADRKVHYLQQLVREGAENAMPRLLKD